MSPRALLPLTCALLLTARAVALEDAIEPAQLEAARQSFDSGAQLSAAGRWAEAERAFRHSHALLPRPSTQFNLAVTLFYQGEHAAALRLLDRFLARTDPVRDEARREPALDLRLRAAAQVATLLLRVAPDNAMVAIRGVAVPESGATRTVYLPPGEHRLRAMAAGFEAVEHTVMAEAGEAAELEVNLSALPPPKPSIVVRTVKTERESPSRAPWAIAIAGGALLAGAGVTGVLALEADHKVTDRCKPAGEPCEDASLRAAQSKATALATVTDVLWISGAAGVLAGVGWLLLSPGEKETVSRSEEVALSVLPGRGGVHSEVRLAF